MFDEVNKNQQNNQTPEKIPTPPLQPEKQETQINNTPPSASVDERMKHLEEKGGKSKKMWWIIGILIFLLFDGAVFGFL